MKKRTKRRSRRRSRSRRPRIIYRTRIRYIERSPRPARPAAKTPKKPSPARPAVAAALPRPPTAYDFELDRRQMNSPLAAKHELTDADVAAYYARYQYDIKAYLFAHNLFDAALRLPNCSLKNKAARDIKKWVQSGDENHLKSLQETLEHYFDPAKPKGTPCSLEDNALQKMDAKLLTEGSLLSQKKGQSWGSIIWNSEKWPWIRAILWGGFKLAAGGICALSRLTSTYLLNIFSYFGGDVNELKSNLLYHVALLICYKQAEWDSMRGKPFWEKFEYVTRTDLTEKETEKMSKLVFNVAASRDKLKEAEKVKERAEQGLPPEEKTWGETFLGLAKTVGYVSGQVGGLYETLPEWAQNIGKKVGKGLAKKAAGGAAGAAVGSVVPIFGTTIGGLVGSIAAEFI